MSRVPRDHFTSAAGRVISRPRGDDLRALNDFAVVENENRDETLAGQLRDFLATARKVGSRANP
jgi:hypothetical protein